MTYWAACFTEPRAEHKARDGVEILDRGAFLPTFVSSYALRGRKRTTEHPILKRYLIIALHGANDPIWSAIGHLDGVQRVLTNDNKPARISSAEVSRLMIAHATGELDVIQHRSAAGRFEKRKRRRARPRHGRTARSSTYIVGAPNHDNRQAS